MALPVNLTLVICTTSSEFLISEKPADQDALPLFSMAFESAADGAEAKRPRMAREDCSPSCRNQEA